MGQVAWCSLSFLIFGESWIYLRICQQWSLSIHTHRCHISCMMSEDSQGLWSFPKSQVAKSGEDVCDGRGCRDRDTPSFPCPSCVHYSEEEGTWAVTEDRTCCGRQGVTLSGLSIWAQGSVLLGHAWCILNHPSVLHLEQNLQIIRGGGAMLSEIQRGPRIPRRPQQMSSVHRI